MKVCDRCKKKLDTDKPTILAGRRFELCLACAEYIANHIENYRPKGNKFFKGFKEVVGG